MIYHITTDGTCIPARQCWGGTITVPANGSACQMTDTIGNQVTLSDNPAKQLTDIFAKAERQLRKFKLAVERLLKTKTATDTLIHTSTEDPSDKVGGVDWATRPEQMPSSYG